MRTGTRSVGLAIASMMATIASAFGQVVDLSQSGPSGTAFTWVGAQANASAGSILYRADVNNDGRNDLVVGAPGGGAAAQGAAYIAFMGPPHTGAVSLSTANVVLTGEASGDRFGAALGAGMIVSREVTPNPRDVIIGAPAASGGRGAVYLFAGPFAINDQRSAANALLKIVGAPGDQLGSAIVAADVDGDGYRDIVMAAPGTGRIYVVYGGPSLAGVWDLAVRSADVTIAVGIGPVTLTAEDFNADGMKDLAIGLPTGFTNTGVVYVINGRSRAAFGSAGSAATLANAAITGTAQNDVAGWALDIADVNGDGKFDLVVGAPGAAGPAGRSGAGAAYVFLGNTGFPTAQSVDAADMKIFGAGSGDRLGTALAHGNLRRDLQDDLVMLAPGASPAGDLEVVYGRPRAQLPPVVDTATAANRVLRGNAAMPPIQTALVLEITGEGAQDIIAGVPGASAGGSAGAGVLQNVYSPTLAASPRTPSITVAQGASSPLTINITNIGTGSIPWAARSNSGWLSLTPAVGSSSATVPGQLTLTVAPGNLPPGTYHGGFSYVSRSGDLIWADDGGVNLTVTAGTPGAPPPPPNPFGVPDPPDEGSPSGVATPAGTSVAVLPVRDVLVTFASVSAPGLTRVDILSSSQANGTGIFWGPWFYRISTTAIYAGPITIGIAYDASLTTTAQGAVRIWNSSALPTVRVDSVKRLVFATSSSLPATVTVQNDLNTDFNDDGLPDLLWQRPSDGTLVAWFMNGTSMQSAAFFTPKRVGDPNWQMVGVGDFNADGFPDLLWRNNVTGVMGVWLMQGTAMQSAVMLNPSTLANPSWKIVAVADFDGDKKPDLLWRHDGTGQLAVWYMDGVTLKSVAVLNPDRVVDTHWKVAGVADFNGDGHPDLLWRNDLTGALGVWYLNGAALSSVAMFSPGGIADLDWDVSAVGDLNGDGHPDILWHHRTTGLVGAWLLNGVTMQSVMMLTPGVVDPTWRPIAIR